jgi:hypothetical protein
MPLSAGDKLGHYEVLSLLGQGGMGELYRVRDTTLKREWRASIPLLLNPPQLTRRVRVAASSARGLSPSERKGRCRKEKLCNRDSHSGEAFGDLRRGAAYRTGLHASCMRMVVRSATDWVRIDTDRN